MRRTLYTHTKTVRALPITSIGINGVRSGSVIDLGVNGNDFRDVLVVPYTGAITDGTHTFTVQESDDGVTFTAVAAGQILGTAAAIAAADDFRGEDLDFGVIPQKQYLRLQVTSTGVTSGGTIGASVVLAEGSNASALRTGS
jgi:hypothetical protein